MTMTQRPVPIGLGPSRVKKGDIGQDAYAMLVSTVRELINHGVFQSDMGDAELITQTFSAAIHGIVSMQIMRADKDPWVQWRPVQDRVRIMLDVMVHGFTDCAAHS